MKNEVISHNETVLWLNLISNESYPLKSTCAKFYKTRRVIFRLSQNTFRMITSQTCL